MKKNIFLTPKGYITKTFVHSICIGWLTPQEQLDESSGDIETYSNCSLETKKVEVYTSGSGSNYEPS